MDCNIFCATVWTNEWKSVQKKILEGWDYDHRIQCIKIHRKRYQTRGVCDGWFMQYPPFPHFGHYLYRCLNQGSQSPRRVPLQVFPGHFPGQFSSISRFFQVFIVAWFGQKCHFPGFSRLNFSSNFPNENVLKIHKRANFSIKKITKTFKTNKVK